MDSPQDVVGRVAAILKTLSESEPSGASTSAIARISVLPRPTVHRLLTSLLEHGYADRDDASGLWFLGPETFLMGAVTQHRYDVSETAQPAVRRLSLATGESAFFSARRGNETVCLLREDGSYPLRSHVLHEGIRFPLGVASAGLVILAYLTPVEISTYLDGADLPESFGVAHHDEAILGRIEETRREGWALNPGLIVPGSWGMAAAVFDGRDRPAWALSLTGIEQRFTVERQAELGARLLHEAHMLTSAIKRTRPHSQRPG